LFRGDKLENSGPDDPGVRARLLILVHELFDGKAGEHNITL